MHIPPGVEVVVQECFAEEGGDSPGVLVAEVLTIMANNEITAVGVVSISEKHLIVIGYRAPVQDPGNAKSSLTAGRSGSSKR